MKNEFEKQLEIGHVFETELMSKLIDKGWVCRITDQTPGSQDRIDYQTIDIVANKNNTEWLFECKLNITPFRKCKELCGWDSDMNCILSPTCYKRYLNAKQAVIAVKCAWTGEIRWTEISNLKKQTYKVINGRTGIRYNFDMSNWKIWK